MMDRPVMELAKKLSQAIADNGGAKALWEQLDPRFKAVEPETLEGIKPQSSEDTISYSAFEKAIDRLAKESYHKSYEKMDFGIRGNPLLMMNVLSIMGLNSLSDLMAEKPQQSNPSGKLFTIDSKIDRLSEQLTALADEVDVNTRRRSRITALKTAKDFEQITSRLTSILQNNEDKYVDASVFEAIEQRYTLAQKFTKEDIISDIASLYNFVNEQKLLERQLTKNRFVSAIIGATLQFSTIENKSVLYFYNICDEYHEYCFYNKLLRAYHRTIMDEKVSMGERLTHEQCNICVLSPLYTLLLYLTLTLQYTEKIQGPLSKYISVDDTALANSIRLSIQRYTTETLPENGKAGNFVYLGIVTNYMVKQIAKVLKRFPLLEKSPQPGQYDQYKSLLADTVNIYSKILVLGDEPTLDEISKYSGLIKTMYDIHSLKMLDVIGKCSLTTEIVDELDVLANKLSTLARNTLRDING
jgi:hypothetical protein